MTSNAEHAQPQQPRPAAHIPADEQLRRQGIRLIASADELAFPDVWKSDEELDEFLVRLVRLAPR